MDATVITSRSRTPKGGEVSPTDPEAGWTKKRGSYHHGYKMHACVGMPSMAWFMDSWSHRQPQWQKTINSLWNKTRSGVEITFAHLKGKQGLDQARYFGIEMNAQWAVMNAIAYNLARAVNILPPAEG